MLSLYVNYRASSFVCLFVLKNKELLKFEPQMSFLLDKTSQQKGVSQFLINWFLCARLCCILDVSINLDWLTLKV